MLSNELSVEERERWEAHLLTCSNCRQEMLGIESALKAYGSLPGTDPPLTVVESVLAEAQKGEEANQNIWTTLKGSLWSDRVWRPALAAATLVAVILVGSDESGRKAIGIRSISEVIHHAEQKRGLDPIARGLLDLRKRIGIHGLAEYIEDPQGFPRPDPEADPIYRRVRALRRVLGIRGLPELIEDARKNA